MVPPPQNSPEEEHAVIFDISLQLEAELLRRAREKGARLESEAKEILERHAQEESTD